MSREDDGFLTRWARRKAEVKREAAAALAVVPPEAEAPAEPEPAFDVSLLPSIEGLTGSSDITMFLQKGVPEALKNAALRKTWASDPAIRDYIGLADFQWDFNAPGAITGYGELAAGTDITAMMADITDHHLKQVAEVVQEAIDAPAVPPPDAAVALESDTEPDSLAGLEAPAEDEVEPAQVAHLAPRRRHGGATPR